MTNVYDSDSDSVSNWIERTKQGDESAAERIWQRYFQALVHHAQRYVPTHLAQMSDGEDFALAAFQALLDGFRNGRFQHVTNRGDLWRILATIAGRRAVNHVKSELRQRRGGARRRQLDGDDVVGERVAVDSFDDPVSIAQFTETVQALFTALPNDELRAVASLRLAGHEIKDIAAQMQVSSRTIDRKLEMIRVIWKFKD
ncbi:MAG TPA: ECF-type sigma factor [Pirellulaceae bacterium]|nr:ECF-type sigma factor [Pirellulaceae bacterium]